MRGLTVLGDRGEAAVVDLDLDIRAGEIVGVAGVSGNGQRELVEDLAGQRRREAAACGGRRGLTTATRGEMVRRRIACLPEEPLRNACVGDMSVAENIGAALLRPAAASPGRPAPPRPDARARAALIETYKVKTPGPDAAIRVAVGRQRAARRAGARAVGRGRSADRAQSRASASTSPPWPRSPAPASRRATAAPPCCWSARTSTRSCSSPTASSS